MMRLLPIYCTIVFFCLLANSENRALRSLEVEFPVKVCETQVVSGSPECAACDNWLKAYFYMFRVLNPEKQLDLPVEQNKSWGCFHSTVLPWVKDMALTVRQEGCCAPMYTRLLAERYLNGFYIYTLRKLLI